MSLPVVAIQQRSVVDLSFGGGGDLDDRLTVARKLQLLMSLPVGRCQLLSSWSVIGPSAGSGLTLNTKSDGCRQVTGYRLQMLMSTRLVGWWSSIR